MELYLLKMYKRILYICDGKNIPVGVSLIIIHKLEEGSQPWQTLNAMVQISCSVHFCWRINVDT